ncbi:MAG: ribonuclease P protein component [Candidatus Dasytiphilus stammeri]
MKINKLHMIMLYCPNIYKYARLGFIISKHNIKYAYQRNRIKRLIRESFRLTHNELPSMDFIIIIKKKVDLMNNKIIMEKLKQLWKIYYLLP